MENGTQDVTTAPSAEQPAAGDLSPQAAPVDTQPAGDGVKAPESPQEQHVPYDRFQEVNNKAKAEAERAEAAERKLAELEEQRQAQAGKPAEDDVEPNEETQKLLETWMKKKGLVTQDELRAKETQLQAAQDVAELKAQYKDFDDKTVVDYAKENGLAINNKAGLESVYNLMKSSDPASKEAVRNEIIAELTEKGQIKGQFAEKPGAGGPRMGGSGEQPTSLKGLIGKALSKHSI